MSPRGTAEHLEHKQMQIGPNHIPLTHLPAHPRMESLRPGFQQLKSLEEGVSRSQLHEQQGADLRQLNADIARMRELKPHLNVQPGDHPDFIQMAQDAQNESAQLQKRIDDICAAHRKMNSNLSIIKTPEGPITDVTWLVSDVSPALRDQGVSGVKYTLRNYTDRSDIEVSAEPVRVDGKEDWNYFKYRIAPGGDGTEGERWRGASATIGGKAGYTSNEVLPQGLKSQDLGFDYKKGDLSQLDASQRAFLAQALGDLGVGWLTPTICEHCCKR